MTQLPTNSSKKKRIWGWFCKPFASHKTHIPIDRAKPKEPTKVEKRIVTDGCVLALEKLPALVLDMIFEYVRSSLLAKLACLSRDLYWPAVSRIYTSITFRGRYWFSGWCWLHRSAVNFGTFLSDDGVDLLVRSLQNNPSLRSLVHLVNFPFSSPGRSAYELFPLLTNVRAYYSTGSGPRLGKLYTHMEKLQFDIWSPTPLSSCLVELKISASAYHRERKKSFQKLAQDLVSLGCHLSLRKLLLVSCFPLRFAAGSWGPKLPLYRDPDWISLLDELIAQKATLHLTALGLYGTMDAHTQATVPKLRRCVDLGELRTLVLHIYQRKEHNLGKTFMEAFTKFTPKLDNLTIFPTLVCPTRPSSAICNLLENNIPNQLKELFVLYFPGSDLYGFPTSFDRDRIQETILRAQRSLVKLKLEDGTWFSRQNGWSEDMRRKFKDSLLNDLYDQSAWRNGLPCIFESFHENIRLSYASIKLVLEHIARFRQVFKRDLICKDAATNLPHLTQYIIDMISFDLKREGIVVNGTTFFLDPNATIPSIAWR